MADIALLINILFNAAPSWLTAIQETLIDKGKSLVVAEIDDKQHLGGLELAIKNAVERGLRKFSTLEERDQYRFVLEVLLEYKPEAMKQEVVKVFSIDDSPDLIALSEAYNFRQRMKALSKNKAYEEVDVRSYLSSFFDALTASLYNDVNFREQISDAIKVRAALRGQRELLQTVHIERQEVFMGDKVEGNKPTVSNTTHIGSVTGQVHTGEGDINVSSFNVSSGAVSTKEDFLSALREFMAEVEASRQKGLPEETADDTLTEIEAAAREASKDSPKSNRITERLNNAKTILTAGTGIATAASQLIPLIEGVIHSASKIFM